jgi:CDP-paratose 2-epimerase
MRILVTGGAGFVGSNLAILFRQERGASVTAFDSLRRRGSELALARLREAGVEFVHGDVRCATDLDELPPADLVLECSAEPSVHAGYGGSGAAYLVQTNLVGTFNCLEYARRHGAAMVFLSTSRVYSIAALRSLPLAEMGQRVVLPSGAEGAGWSVHGIAEGFSTTASRSLYGATKLATELLVEEYHAMYDLPAVINRCGVLTGPWQMGKVDQGFFVLWAARFHFGGALRYTGFGGRGHQVRDVLHVADLFALIARQIDDLDRHSGRTYNVGGGPALSISLAELTDKCAAATGRRITITADSVTRAADIPYYVTDTTLVSRETGWRPERSVDRILQEVLDWIALNEVQLRPILS